MTEIIQIETLELEGFTEDEGRRAAHAFETELTALLSRYGLPENMSRQDVAAIDLGDLPHAAKSPEGIGRQMAKALFDEVWS